MKRLLLLLCALTLLLCACRRENGDTDTKTVAHQVRASLSSNTGFTEIDNDLFEISFNFLEQTDDVTVLIDSKSDSTREIGVFHLEKNGSMSTVENGINAYLSEEIASLNSLAALYPSAELAEKLLRYKDALILKSDDYIAYFILDSNELDTAKTAFLTALQ